MAVEDDELLPGAETANVCGGREKNKKKRKMSPVGAGFYRGLYDPDMKMPEPIITSLVFFERLPVFGTFCDLMERHIWPLYRFSSTVQEGQWVPVEGKMDRSYHFTEHTLDEEEEITSYAQSVLCQPLSHQCPLWTVTFLKVRRGRSAMVFRFHHSIGDGLGLLFAFLPLLKCEGSDVLDQIPLPARLKGKRDENETGRRSNCGKTVFKMICCALCTLCRSIVMLMKGLLSVLLIKKDSELRMNGPPGERTPYLAFSGRHMYTRMPPVPLSALKAVKNRHNCSINEAIMAALAGAFRRYSLEKLQDPLLQQCETVECKGFMLLALPRPIALNDPDASLVNNIVTTVFKFPIDEPMAERRIQRTLETSACLKSIPYITGIRLTTKMVTSVAPTKTMRSVTSEAISKASFNVSSVPLPKVPTRLGGEEIMELQMLFACNIPQVSLLTYRETLFWNIVSDPCLMPDAASMGQYFMLELEELAQCGS